MSDGLQCRDVRGADVAPLAQALARAFADDPFHRWMLPDDRAWGRRGASLFALVLRNAHRHGVATTTVARQGAALWARPEAGALPFLDRLCSGLCLAWILRGRARQVQEGLVAMENAHPRRPHWHLLVLGTDPPYQRQGVASALLAPVLAQCAHSATPAYLECSKPRNLAFYRRRGFRVVGEMQMPGGPCVWRMLREPRQ